MLGRWFSLVVVLGLIASPLFAADEASNGKQGEPTPREELVFGTDAEDQPHSHYEAAWLDWFHNPAEGVSMTLDQRLRYVYGWNVTIGDTASYDRGHLDYTRFRTRWGQKVDLDECTSINSRLVWEFRTWDEPDAKPQSIDWDEIIFDRLNITVNNFLGMPVTATVGRQDLRYGTGWLILDGTPLDGSRTIFFDAAKLSWDLGCDTTLDTIYVRNEADPSAWLKPINDHDRALTEQNENAFIAYITNNSLENTQLEGYFIFKEDDKVDFVSTSKEAEIYTFGGAIQSKINDCWNYRIEAAYQTGDKDDNSLRAFGTNNRLTYSFNDEKDSKLHLDFEYLSGDDESTSIDEQFDPLWGEWPQFSELYVYSYIPETNIAEVTNLYRLGTCYQFNPSKCTTFRTAYNLLWADQDKTGTIFNGGGHTFRGQLATAWLTYSCCEQVKAHIVGEYFMPGNYYADNYRGHATFIRFNLEYTF